MNDTIAAISTPYGRGGIALIRISGDDAITVADRVFKAKSGRVLADTPAGRAVYGDLYADKVKLDDGIVTLFRAPSSYTGEDTAELSCHGGILLAARLLTAVLAAGARPAGPGEFTRRAFLSGQLSLSEAEAVFDLIDAQSDEQIRLAKAQLDGSLTRAVDGLYSDLRELVSAVYVYADYPDEDLSDLTPDQMEESLTAIRARLADLLASYKRGKAIREGVAAALVGRPNTGKSSLLNRLLGQDRAIVSEIPGTTRDTVEETVKLDRILLRLADTAGIRQTDDPIESMGVKRSLAAFESAELILAVFDGSQPATGEDLSLIAQLRSCGKRVIAVSNKSDLPRRFDADLSGFDAVLPLSAATGEGIGALTDTGEGMYAAGDVDYDSRAVLSSARQAASVKAALESLDQALESLRAGFTPDVAGLDLEQALTHLGQTDGRAVCDDIVDTIFHRFCVGK